MDANCTVWLFDQTNASDTFAQLKSVCRAWMTPWDIGNDSNDVVMRYFVLAPFQRSWKGMQKSIYLRSTVIVDEYFDAFQALYDPSSFILLSDVFYDNNAFQFFK